MRSPKNLNLWLGRSEEDQDTLEGRFEEDQDTLEKSKKKTKTSQKEGDGVMMEGLEIYVATQSGSSEGEDVVMGTNREKHDKVSYKMILSGSESKKEKDQWEIGLASDDENESIAKDSEQDCQLIILNREEKSRLQK